jgi:uncharacterized membrane protein YhaH (DUF805 family)
VTFPEAVSSTCVRFVRWEGRATRSEYWWWQLFSLLVTGAGVAVDLWLGIGPAVQGMAGLALLLPGLSVFVRRLHDTGRSGWWFWFGLVPVVGPVLTFLWMCTVGHPGPNRFGPAALGSYGSRGAQPRFPQAPVYVEARGYRPSADPAPRRRLPGWGEQDDDRGAAPTMPPFQP